MSGHVDVPSNNKFGDLEKCLNIFLNFNAAIIIHDLKGKILKVNNKFLETFGYSDSDISSLTVKDLLSKESQKICRKVIDDTLNQGSANHEVTIKKKNQDTFPAYAYTSILEIGDTKLIQCLLYDITERKNIETKLYETNQFLDSIIENIPDMLFLKEAEDLRFVRFNKAGEELIGYSREDMLGKNDYDFFPKKEADFFTAKDKAVLKTGESINIPEEKLHTKSKGIRTLHTKKISIHDEEGNPKYLLGISEDITERKQAEGVLKKSQEELERAVRERTSDLSKVNKQLRKEVYVRKKAEEALNANLERLSKKNKYEKIASTVTQCVHRSIDLKEVLENAVQTMTENIETVEHISIYFVEGKEAVLQIQRGFPGGFIEKVSRIPHPKGFTWNTILEGKTRYCPDVDEDTVIGPAGRKAGTKSYVSLPLKIEGNTIGCINVHSYHKNAFDEDDIQLLETVAKQIEIAIGKSKNAEALINSEERYRVLHDENPSMYFTVNEEGHVLSVNRNGIEKLGYSEEELIGHSIYSVFLDEDKPKIKEQLSKCFANPGQIFKWELRKVCKDRRIMPVSELARCVIDSDGNKVALIACEDITERITAEQEKQEAEERYRTIVENTYDLIIETDIMGNISYANHRHEDVLGYDPEEMIGMNCLNLVYKDDRMKIAAAFQKGASTGESVQTPHYRCEHKDGELRWLESIGRSYRDKKGRRRGVISSRDITAHKMAEDRRKRDEEALRDSEERHRALVENSYDFIVEISPDFKFLYVSPNYKSILGYEQEELVGQSIFDNIHPEDRQKVLSKFQKTGLNILNLWGLNVGNIFKDNVFAAVYAQGARELWKRMESAIEKYLESENSLIYRYKTKSGKWLWIESMGRPFWTSGSELRIAISSRDITERIKAQESLRERLFQLSKKNRYESIIREVTESVHQSIDPQDVFENAVESMSNNIEVVDHVAIYFVENEDAVMKANRGYPDWFLKRITIIPKPKGFTWECINKGKVIFCLDAEKDNVIGPAGKEVGTKSYLAIPLKDRGKTIGSINVHSLKKNAFDEDDLRLLETVAKQIEIAINQSRDAEALRNSEERYRTLYQESPSMYFTVNEEGHVLSVNRNGIEKLGYSEEELIGNSVYSVFLEEDKPKIKEQLSKCFANPDQIFKWELRNVCKNGSIISVSELARCVIDSDGNKVALIACEDITERKQAQERFELIVESNPSAIVMIGEDSKIKLINSRAEEIFGYDRSELLGKQIEILMSKPAWGRHVKHRKKFTDTPLPRKMGAGRDLIARRKDGSEFPVEIGLASIHTEDGLMILASIVDITEHKKAEEVLKKSHDELEQAVRERTADLSKVNEQLQSEIEVRKKTEEALEENLEQLSRKNRYEEIINFVTRNIHQSIDLQTVLDNAVEAMRKNIDKLDIASIYLIEGDDIVVKAQRGFTEDYISRAGRIPYPKGVTWKTVIEEKSRYVPNIELGDSSLGPAGKDMGFKCYLIVPLFIDNKVVGTMSIVSFEKNVFDDEELKLLEIVSKQIGIAIRNAKQAETLKLSREELRESEEHYRLLVETTEVIPWEADPKTFQFTYIGPQAEKLLGYPVKKWYEKGFWFSKIHEDDHDGVVNACILATEALKDHELEYRMFTKKGDIRWIYEMVSVIVENGEPKTLRGFMMDITDRKRAEIQLIQSRKQLRKLATRMQSIREEEIARVARGIHDDLGQLLTGLKIELSLMGKKLSLASNGGQLYPVKQIKSISELIDTAIFRVQEISTELRPAILDTLGLIEAIKFQSKKFESHSGIHCEVDIKTNDLIFDQERSIAVYRVLQESLTNIARHANATRIRISLKLEAENLVLEVEDNGRGIKDSDIVNPKSVGILGMKERVLVLGGDLKIKGIPKKGTIVSIILPLNNVKI